MSFYDRLRWAILSAAATYHILVCAARVGWGLPQTQWVHDRPDWFVKFITLQQTKPDFPEFARLKQQAVTELEFRRSTGVSK